MRNYTRIHGSSWTGVLPFTSLVLVSKSFSGENERTIGMIQRNGTITGKKECSLVI